MIRRLGPLEERPFRLLFLARTASLLGNAFAPIALAFAVLDELDGSPTALGLVLAAAWVPHILFTLVGGVWADRLPRNLVMVATDVLEFAAQGTAAVLLLTGAAELWMLAVTQVVRGTAMAFFYPAATGLVPQVVSAGRLQQANALLRMSQSSSNIAGAAAAGVVVALAGAGWALALDAVTFLVSAAFLVRLRVPPAVREAGASLVRELREGWDEFRSREWLWAIVAASSIGNLCFQAGVIVLGPVVASRELGGAAAWGAVAAGIGVGLLLGGLLSLRLRPKRPLLVAQLSVLAAAPLFVALAIPAPLPVIVLAAVVVGIGFELFGVYWDTALQQHVPHDRLSRVGAWDQLGSFVVIPVGLSLAGPLADGLGVAETILLSGGVFLLGQSAALLSRDVRTLPRTEAATKASAATPPGEGFGLPTTEREP